MSPGVKLTKCDIEHRLPKFVKIDFSTYKNSNTKAKFIDSEYGEWWARPCNVLNGAMHPIRGYGIMHKPRKLTAELVQQRLPPYLSLDRSTYVNTSTKARFIDSEFGEWWVFPNAVFAGHQHPSRRKINKKKPSTSKFLPNGKTINEYAVENNLPRNSQASSIYKNYGPHVAKEWIEARSTMPRGSSLELFVLKKFDWEKWNKTVGVKTTNGGLYRPDFKINDRIYIDVDGLYWHDETKKDKKYHIEKRIHYSANGLQIFQFYQNELLYKADVVSSIINAKTGKLEKRFFARSLSIMPVDNAVAVQFLIDNHLMGGYSSAKHIGLFSGDSLISVMSYKKYKNGIDISRFCNKINTSVVGGLSRLIAAIELKERPAFIQSFVDLRYGTGNSLTKIGFLHDKTTLGWKWTDGVNTFNRLKCRANMDKRGLSEREHAEELGWTRIYDAGQAKFIKYNKLTNSIT